MKIAMVSEHASPLAVLGGVDAGGQNVHVAALAGALARRGDDVVVHTRRDAPELAPRVRVCGVCVDHVDAGPAACVPKDELLPFIPAFAEELEERWTMARPDVVHAHFWMSGLAALRAARDLEIPVVHTFHALGSVKHRFLGDADPSPARRIEYEAQIARSVARVVATCTDEVFELLRMGADRHRITVVPCGVDLRRFTPDGPSEARGAPYRLVAACRLVERKGLADAITALADVPHTELVIAGGPERAALADDAEARRLSELAHRVGVADRVVFRGRVDRDAMPPLLRSADAVVSVPWYEPFGIVPLEAMACGVPVVASAVGGQIDSIVHEVTGVHVPPREPETLARALRRLLADTNRRVALGDAGAARARLRYGFDRIARATRRTYAEEIAAGARHPAIETAPW